jgi:hypothetical protein
MCYPEKKSGSKPTINNLRHETLLYTSTAFEAR